MSAKHDVPRTRTAEDLERKYNLAEMKKSYEMAKDTLTRVNRNITDFVNLIVGSLESLDGTVDGQIVAYFYNGVPGQETYPMVDWGDSYDNHIEDIYYDREEGNVYTFRKNGDTYEWLLTDNVDKIRAMAIANATIDTKDNFRRIFLEQPAPPYNNGDLWLKTGEIYVCQITKASTEAFEDKDFILSTSYAGDTLAFKVGNELQVLKGTVLTVQEGNNQFSASIQNLDTELRNLIALTESGFSAQVESFQKEADKNYNAVNEELNTFKKILDFTENGLIIRSTNSTSQVQIDDDMIQILVGGYMKIIFDALGRGVIPNLSVTEHLELLGIGIVEENGHIYGSFDEGEV
jgi:hypothetical protein